MAAMDEGDCLARMAVMVRDVRATVDAIAGGSKDSLPRKAAEVRGALTELAFEAFRYRESYPLVEKAFVKRALSWAQAVSDQLATFEGADSETQGRVDMVGHIRFLLRVMASRLERPGEEREELYRSWRLLVGLRTVLLEYTLELPIRLAYVPIHEEAEAVRLGVDALDYRVCACVVTAKSGPSQKHLDRSAKRGM